MREGTAYRTVDELNDPFDEVLQPGGHAGGGLLGRHAEQEQEEQAEADREQHAVDVDRPEAHRFDFFGTVREGPGRLLQDFHVAMGIVALVAGGS